MELTLKKYIDFWKEHPGLIYGLGICIGFAHAYTKDYTLLFPLLLLLFPAFFVHAFLPRSIATLFLSLSALVCGLYPFSFSDIPKEGIKGTALFQIDSISRVKNSFSSSYLYKGSIKNFSTLASTKLPCTLRIKESLNRPKGHTYLIEGTLFSKSRGNYHLKIDEKASWRRVRDYFNFSEWRFLAKESVKKHISSKVKNMHVSELLSGLFTGEITSNILKHNLKALGMQHVLAISGFHFSLLAWLLSLLIKPLLSPKLATYSLILLLTLYFLFVGPSPSVQRAWISILIFLVGQLIGRESLPLNRLGLSLIIILLINPLSCLQMGFQLSFFATFGILLFYPIIEEYFSRIWKKRPLSQALKFNLINKLGLILLTFFKRTLALNISVFLVTFLLLLTLFQEFPLLSLVYNLFFPFLLSLSFIFLILSLILDVIMPFMGTYLHMLNELYTTFILRFITHVPTPLTNSIHTEAISQKSLIYYFSLLLMVGIFLNRHTKEKQQSKLFNYL
ncbi:MAG: ComEC/Rec2 family competence protein [Chlamydiales bacterium]|nr:ComEC/Rec2 family competence protein [Chlamydiales bacterium]